MSSQTKSHHAEPSIVVDRKLVAPAWTSEETVVFHREMFEPKPVPPKSRSLRPWAIAAIVLVAAAAAVRWLLLQ